MASLLGTVAAPLRKHARRHSATFQSLIYGDVAAVKRFAVARRNSNTVDCPSPARSTVGGLNLCSYRLRPFVFEWLCRPSAIDETLTNGHFVPLQWGKSFVTAVFVSGAVSGRFAVRKGQTILASAGAAALATALTMYPTPTNAPVPLAQQRFSRQEPATFAQRFFTPINAPSAPFAADAQIERAKAELAQAMQAQTQQPDVSDDATVVAQSPKVPLPRTRPLASKLMASLGPYVADQRQASPDALSDVSAALRKVFAMLQPSGVMLASASRDGGITNDGRDGSSGLVTSDKQTAVYDISARTVYMPDGTRLEAHSGFRDLLDDPRHVDVKARGATPPQVYELKLREKLFHGVQALRMTPVGEGDLYGRNGLLAHSYMLGPKGDSNGCVSFKDYDAFLKAFQSGSIKRLVVVKTISNEAIADAGKV